MRESGSVPLVGQLLGGAPIERGRGLEAGGGRAGTGAELGQGRLGGLHEARRAHGGDHRLGGAAAGPQGGATGRCGCHLQAHTDDGA
jgi:hypothetical protein